MRERDLHKAVAVYLSLALPPGAWFTSIPGGNRGMTTTPGYASGTPDLLIIWNGIAQWIELKAERGRLSVAQKAMHLVLERAGSPVYTARSLAEVEQVLLGLGIVPKAKVA